MPYNMKKAGKKYRKGGSKRKQKGGEEMVGEGSIPQMRAVRDEWTPRRDSIFVSNNGVNEYLTTDPKTGLPKRGRDPLSPQQRLEQMAIKNRRIDVDYENYLEDKKMQEFYEKTEADRMVDDIIKDDIDDYSEDTNISRPQTTMPEPKKSDWKEMMEKRPTTPIKNQGPVWGNPKGKMGPGYKRGGSVKKGAKGRNGIL